MTIPINDCVRRITRGRWWEDAICQRCTFPIGPLNTYSNVAYLLGALAVVRWDHSFAGWVMGGCLLVLAIGSFLYHGFKTIPMNDLDRAGIYLVFGAMGTH
ncbi:MAG TPA: hypothetical protein VM487_12175, partial [Phycisphaerae bacterium]|nr:hypothetical protein [Phycisphaerae bacterium]